MNVYVIVDNESNEFFATRNNKAVWGSSAAAKNAFLGDQSLRHDKRVHHFKDQDEYSCYKVNMEALLTDGMEKV